MNSTDLRPVLDINIINFKLKIFEITTHIYLLLAKFEGCTVIYGPSFPPLIYGPSVKCAGHNSKGKNGDS